MNLFKNKKAIGLPMVLGIIVFVIGITTALMSFIMFQSSLVQIDIDQTEDYQNAVTSVNAAVQIIAREENLETDFLQSLETYFNVDITAMNSGVYSITSMIDTSNQVISYMTGSAGNSNIVDSLFSKTGGETDFSLSPLITPTTMISTFLPDYISQSFPWITPETGFTSFGQLMDYVEDLAKANSGFQYKKPKDLEDQWNPTAWWNWYVDGDVDIDKEKRGPIKNLTVPEGQILFINGDLTMNEGSTIYGNVVINGDLKIKDKGNSIQSVLGTIYVNGDVEIEGNLLLGTIEHPTFIFAEGDIKVDKADGVGYFLCDEFDSKNNSDITGGVYVTEKADLPTGGITANTSIDSSMLYDFAIPSTIETETPDQGTGTTFVYTFPKLT
ncbi:hypothetical protein [Mariniplasma anaerobium]|uniref:Uncharacterized protein n=1 Tax=Mariniplasma anaerobium TaxID=2735436 RepID=A0A7U9TIS8_9MOLU|nr:hypothetical protein [Mariniplasma anaerobium]BCR35575.1 hypothetical protein MPAN_004680 [Mariniplasma anaerobium]